MRALVVTAVSLALAVAALPGPARASAQDASVPLVPAGFRLGDAAAKAIAADWLKPDERKDLRILHGVWDERDLDTPARQALAALVAWELDHPALRDDAAPRDVRAEARLLAGDAEGAIALLDGLDSMRAARLRAEALETLGRFADADVAVDAPVQRLLARKVDRARRPRRRRAGGSWSGRDARASPRRTSRRW
ncbi:MAG: hypothetical protein U0575_06190 [Phycisphaerales bacterium]